MTVNMLAYARAHDHSSQPKLFSRTPPEGRQSSRFLYKVSGNSAFRLLIVLDTSTLSLGFLAVTREKVCCDVQAFSTK